MTDIQRIGTEPIQKPGKSKQDYGTPWEFIRGVAARFGPIAVDLAASKGNAKADIYFDEAMDSLSIQWHAEARCKDQNLWLNPPFADIEPWAAKCAYESARRRGFIFLLTPASIGSNWFSKHVRENAMVLGLSPRLTFEGTKDPYPKDLMLSVFGYGMRGFDTWRWDSPTPSESVSGDDK